jgi:uncharacterized protein (TIGR03382 family)
VSAVTAGILVDAGPHASGGCGAAGAFGSGAVLALPILLVVVLLGRRRGRSG